MSNLPSTEELQRLLDEATPGEWRMYAETDAPKIYGVQTTAGEPICIDGTPQDCQIIQFTRDLAAEVIRLRKVIEAMRADSLRAKIEFGGASLFDSFARHHHANIIHRLTLILEGEQA